jgi:hypothetical protein
MNNAYRGILGGEKVIVTIFKCKIRVSYLCKRDLFAFVFIFVGHVFIKLRRFTIYENVSRTEKIKNARDKSVKD